MISKERIALLADRIAPTREILERFRTNSGSNIYVLECGHDLRHAPHFSLSKNTHMRCRKCGELNLLSHPVYGKEFKN